MRLLVADYALVCITQQVVQTGRSNPGPVNPLLIHPAVTASLLAGEASMT